MKYFSKLYYLPIILARTVITTDEQYSKREGEILKTIKWLVILLILTSSITYSQSLENKTDKYFFENNKELGGECILKNSRVSIDGNIISKTFEFEVPVSGNYYMSAWIMGAETKNGLQEYNVTLDNLDTIAGKIIMTKTGWQTANLSNMANKLKSQSLYLTEGKHSISIQYEQPDVPEVEFVKFSRNEELSVISDLRYRSYLDSIKQISLNRNQSLWEKKDTLSPDSKTELPNPEGDYSHQVNISFGYTTYKRIYLYSGSFVTIRTYASDYYEHVLEVFSAEYPENYSWVSKSYHGLARMYRKYITYSGYYYIRIRAYRQGTYGLADLDIWVDYGDPYQLHYDDCPVTGNGFRCYHTSTSTYNYFTCKLTGDSRIWIEHGSGIPGKIITYNDDYGYHGGDFYWGLASRVKKSFSTPVGATLISSYSSYNPTGYCDVFMKCGNASYSSSYFPNLKSDDAIRSDSDNGNYNCINWSGGMASSQYIWVWPPWDWPWTSSPYNSNTLQAFDNYYGNKKYNGSTYYRYVGAQTYTKNGAYSYNGIVALWYNSNSWDIMLEQWGSYTHGSVRKPGNNHPHGYDWESKTGGLQRFFHPRFALENYGTNKYGGIQYYYKYPSSKGGSIGKNLTLEQSITSGLTVIENIKFTESENIKIQNLKKNIPENIIIEFNSKYKAWKEIWNNPEISMHSYPGKYIDNKQYEEFYEFCELQGKTVLPLLFENYENGCYFDRIPIMQLTKPYYKQLQKQIEEELKKNKYDSEGKYIAPLPRRFWMRYIKKIIESFDSLDLNKSKLILKTEQEKLYLKEVFLKQNFPNPVSLETEICFGLPEPDYVTLEVFNSQGQLAAILLKNKKLPAGSNIIKWNIQSPNNLINLNSGVYIYKLTTSTKIITKKLNIL